MPAGGALEGLEAGGPPTGVRPPPAPKPRRGNDRRGRADDAPHDERAHRTAAPLPAAVAHDASLYAKNPATSSPITWTKARASPPTSAAMTTPAQTYAHAAPLAAIHAVDSAR